MFARALRRLRRTQQNEMINAEARECGQHPRAPNVRFRSRKRAGPMDHLPGTNSKGSPSVLILRQQTFTGKERSSSIHSGQAESEVSHDD
jgi:hypothetical protein